MGKSRDSRRHKVPKDKTKPRAGDDEDSEEEYAPAQRGLGRYSHRVSHTIYVTSVKFAAYSGT